MQNNLDAYKVIYNKEVEDEKKLLNDKIEKNCLNFFAASVIVNLIALSFMKESSPIGRPLAILGSNILLGSIALAATEDKVKEKMLNYKTRYKNSMSMEAFICKTEDEKFDKIKIKKFKKILTVGDSILKREKDKRDSALYNDVFKRMKVFSSIYDNAVCKIS
jgi:hypothetical protein